MLAYPGGLLPAPCESAVFRSSRCGLPTRASLIFMVPSMAKQGKKGNDSSLIHKRGVVASPRSSWKSWLWALVRQRVNVRSTPVAPKSGSMHANMSEFSILPESITVSVLRGDSEVYYKRYKCAHTGR